MRNLVKEIGFSTGLRQASIVVVGNIIAQGISAIAIILITRSLTPAAFGAVSVGISLVAVITRLTDLGFATALPKVVVNRSQKSINHLLATATRLKLIACGSTLLIGLLFGQPLADLLHLKEPLIIYLAFGLSCLTILYEYLQTILFSLQRFGTSVLVNISQAMAKLLGIALLIFSQTATVVSLYSWYNVAPVVPLLFIRRLLPAWIRLIPVKSSAETIPSFHELAGHAAISYIALGITENIDILFVQRFLSSYETGLLGGVTRIALLFSLAAVSLSSVLNPRVAQYHNLTDLKQYLRKATLLVVVVCFVFVAFLTISPYLLIWTIGEQYFPGIGIMNISVGASFLAIATAPVAAAFFSLHYPRYFSIVGLLQLLIVVIGNVAFVPLFGLPAAAWTRLTAKGLTFLLTVLLVFQKFRKRSALDVRNQVCLSS